MERDLFFATKDKVAKENRLSRSIAARSAKIVGLNILPVLFNECLIPKARFDLAKNFYQLAYQLAHQIESLQINYSILILRF